MLFLKAIFFLLLLNVFTNCSSKSETKERIIGGEVAKIGQFPFAAGIFYQKNVAEKFCGGSLINSKWILTAAHCLENGSNFTVYLGTINLEPPNSNGLVVKSEKYIIHPNYVSSTLANDIGLLALDSEVGSNDNIKSIDLASSTIGASQEVTVIGWGSTSSASTSKSNILNYVSLSTISNSNCAQYYGSYIRDTIVCAAGIGNQGTCSSDSGGPLIQIDKDGKAIHVGVAIFHSGKGCEAQEPSGFTRTFDYVDWIKNMTQTSSAFLETPSILLLWFSVTQVFLILFYT